MIVMLLHMDFHKCDIKAAKRTWLRRTIPAPPLPLDSLQWSSARFPGGPFASSSPVTRLGSLLPHPESGVETNTIPGSLLYC